MNIINKLTLRHLKTNKGRTAVTIIGIAVAVAMITALFITAASFIKLIGDLSAFDDGTAHFNAYSASADQANEVRSDENVEAVGVRWDMTDNAVQLPNARSYRTGTGMMVTADKSYYEMIVTCKYDGMLPQNINEIAVEKEFIEKNDLAWKIGDTVELTNGNRTITDSDGVTTLWNSSYRTNEKFEPTQNGTYRITAILHDNNPTQKAPVLRGLSNEEVNTLTGQGELSLSVKIKNPGPGMIDELKKIADKYGIECRINYTYIASFGAIDADSSVATVMLPMIAVILVIIIVASISLIYNAFGMSLSERVRYLGMLASVGATKRQKRNSVFFEGFILGAAGIALGLLIGIIGSKITLHLLSDPVIKSGMIEGAENSGITFDAVVPLWVIVASVAFSAITIFISAVIPARKASAITPIDAIRQQSERKLKAKSLKSSKLVRKIFGYEGELANKALKRNKKKTRLIVFSISLSVVLFLSVNYFSDMIQKAANVSGDMPYQISVNLSYDKAKIDQLRSEIEGISDVKGVYGVNEAYGEYGPESELPMAPGVVEDNNLTPEYKKLLNIKVPIYVTTIEDESFREICEKNGIAPIGYFDGEVKGLLVNALEHRDNAPEVFNKNVIGKLIHADYMDNDIDDVTIGGLIPFDSANKLYSLNMEGALTVFVPESTKYDYVIRNTQEDERSYISYRLSVETDKHTEVTEKIESILETGEYQNAYVQDMAEMTQLMMTIGFVIRVLVNCFAVLMALISVANIVNTISTEVMLRRKEFAMLQSVGMTPKGFRRMIRLQSLFYGLRSLVIGIPVSILISWFIYFIEADGGGSYLMFSINIPMYIAVIAVVFGIILLTMAYSMHKVKGNSIIETLKEDIL